METKETFRFTVDLPKEHHRRLKTAAALSGKTMRDIIVEALDKFYSEQKHLYHKVPNAETQKALQQAEQALADLKKGRKPKNAKVFKNWDAFLKDLGI